MQNLTWNQDDHQRLTADRRLSEEIIERPRLSPLNVFALESREAALLDEVVENLGENEKHTFTRCERSSQGENYLTCADDLPVCM